MELQIVHTVSNRVSSVNFWEFRLLPKLNFGAALSSLLKRFLAYFLEKTDRKLEETYLEVVGATKLIKEEYSIESAKEGLIEVRKVIRKFREQLSAIEKLESEDIIHTKELMESVMTALYDLEFELRRKANQNNQPKQKTSEGADFTTRVFRKSLAQQNAYMST